MPAARNAYHRRERARKEYEQKRDELFKKLDGADTELENINQVNCVFTVPAGIF